MMCLYSKKIWFQENQKDYSIMKNWFNCVKYRNDVEWFVKKEDYSNIVVLNDECKQLEKDKKKNKKKVNVDI